MKLSLGGPGLACSALRVRRLEAGELFGAERAAAERHVSECGRCRAARAEVESERAALARELPFESFAAGVAERLARAPARPGRRGWSRGPAVAALAAGLALAVAVPWALRPGAAPADGARTKGAARLGIYALDGDRPRLLAAGEPVPAGARLRLDLHPAGHGQVAVALVDSDGVAILYAGPAIAGPLPDGFEWTGAGAEALLLLLLADEPVDRRALEVKLTESRGPAASLAAAAARAAPGAEVVAIPLRRAEKR